MPPLRPVDQQAITGSRLPPPMLLIAFWAGVYVLMLAIHGTSTITLASGNSPFQMQIFMGLSNLEAIVLDWKAFLAWWLALFVSHNKRSSSIPIACVAVGALWNSIIIYLVRNFYSANSVFGWSDFGQEYSRQLTWSIAASGMHLVCIGGVCYLASRFTNLQLNQSNRSPQPITFNIGHILGLTLIVAVGFAAVRWANSSKPDLLNDMLSSDVLTVFSAISGLSVGVNWAILSWIYAKGSVRLGAIAVACLVLVQLALSLVSFWIITHPPTPRAATTANCPFNQKKLSDTFSKPFG